MTAIGQHIRLRLEDDRVIAPTPPAQRCLANILYRHGQELDLLSFGCADTHLHVETAGSHPAALELDRRIKILMSKRLHPGVGFQRSKIDDIKNQWHLFNTFKYSITQDGNHGCRADPFLEATVLPDLLGLRVTGAYITPRVRTLLPRVNRQMLLGWLGVEGFGEVWVEPQLALLPDAAAAAVAMPHLTGKHPAVVAARLAAVQLASRQLRTSAVAELLALSVRSVKRLRSRPADPAVLRAVELQLQLRTLAHRAAGRLQLEAQGW